MATQHPHYRFLMDWSPYPDHAIRITNIHAIWNQIEHGLAHMLAILSGSNPFDVAVTLNALSNSASKLALVTSTGKRALQDFPSDCTDFRI